MCNALSVGKSVCDHLIIITNGLIQEGPSFAEN